jgi:[ribosomal protein S18]-alanine N-acetyltransferase
MIALLRRLWPRAAPALSEAGPRDAATISALHGVSFHRGWTETEVETLLTDRAVIAHRATAGRKLAGFILSRIAGDEAEILSVAVAPVWRNRGVGRTLLALHLRRLAGLGARAVFLEVGATNGSANKIYAGAGFREVGRRPNYYQEAAGRRSDALVLRRDLS